ncbi:hypothetical protein E2320_013670 [Naja naja]|nr:hypothetical protein E2320_013670 [Naja naja]
MLTISCLLAKSNFSCPLSYSKNTHHLLGVGKVQFLAILFAIPKILTMSWMLAESNSWPSSFQFQKYSLISCLLVKSNCWLSCFLFQKYSPSPGCCESPIFGCPFSDPKILTICPGFWQCPIPGWPLSFSKNTHHLLGVGNVQFLALHLLAFAKVKFLSVFFPIPKILTISWMLAKFYSWPSCFLFQKYSPSRAFWQSPIPGHPVSYSKNTHCLLIKSNSWLLCFLFQRNTFNGQPPIKKIPGVNTHHLLNVGNARFLAVLFPFPKILTISWMLAMSNFGCPVFYSKNTHHLLGVGKVQFLADLFPIPKILTISWMLGMSNFGCPVAFCKNTHHLLGVGKVQFWLSCFQFQKYSPSPGC